MTIKVLIVDDSSFLLQQIKQIISAEDDMEVIGQACNGKEAIDLAKKLKPDVITMDYEMPLMDGITAVKIIMDEAPTKILMFSSLTYDGAQTTLDALDAGAVDFLSKSFEGVTNHKSRLSSTLCNKIRLVASVKKAQPSSTKISSAANSNVNTKNTFAKPRTAKVDLIVIGASTGGPVALANVLMALPKSLNVPILIIQHMPASFTGAFSERLNQRCNMDVKMAENDDDISNGGVYVAPGGKQMLLTPTGKINIREGDEQINYKPCIDLTFASCSKSNYKNILAIIMTGMGSDGKKGSQILKEKGHEVWAQSCSSCVVDGMPSAIINADIADCVYHLDDISGKILEQV